MQASQVIRRHAGRYGWYGGTSMHNPETLNPEIIESPVPVAVDVHTDHLLLDVPWAEEGTSTLASSVSPLGDVRARPNQPRASTVVRTASRRAAVRISCGRHQGHTRLWRALAAWHLWKRPPLVVAWILCVCVTAVTSGVWSVVYSPPVTAASWWWAAGLASAVTVHNVIAWRHEERRR